MFGFIRQPKLAPLDVVPDAPTQGDTAWQSFNFFSGATNHIAWDEDHLKATKGWRIYREMLQDDQVKSAYTMVVDLITSRSFRFVPQDDTPEQEKIIEFLNFTVEKSLRGTLNNVLRQVLTSKANGYSVNEICMIPGMWEGKESWLLKSVNLKAAHTFKFEIDAFGTVHKLLQDQNSSQVPLDPSKFIIAISNNDIDPVYGVSDLIPAYRHWWSKQNLIRFRNIHLERLAGGMLIAKPGEDTVMDTSQTNNLQTALLNASSQASMILPRGIDLEVIQASASNDFENSIDSSNMGIARSLLVSGLLGITPQKNVGSFALGKVQEKLFFLSLKRQGDDLADTVNEQLWKRLVWWNFGVEDFPRMEFDPMTDEEKRETVKAYTDAIKGGAIATTTNDDENRNRMLLGYEPLEEDEFDDEEKEEEDARGNPKDKVEASAKFATDQAAIDNRVDFPEMEKHLNDIEKQFTIELTEATDLMFTGAVGHLPSIMNEFRGKDFNAIKLEEATENLVSVDSKKGMNSTVRLNLDRTYNDGRAFAIDEIVKAKDEAEFSFDPPRSAIADGWNSNGMIEGLVARFVDGIDPQTAAEYIAAKAFQITGNLTDDIESAIKTIIINGIRDEKTLDEMVDELTLVLKPVIGTHDSEGKRINLGARIENIVRTSMSEAYNQARLAVYNDPELGDFVQAYQYSAILDSRTTDFCRNAHGKIYRKTDPQWSNITPPNHFQCRSVLVAVTENDEFEESKPLPKNVQPAAGFGKEE